MKIIFKFSFVGEKELLGVFLVKSDSQIVDFLDFGFHYMRVYSFVLLDTVKTLMEGNIRLG